MLSYSFTIISPDVVLISTIVFSFPPLVLHDAIVNRKAVAVRYLKTVFMKTAYWLITFC